MKNPDRYVTVLTVEQIEDRIKTCDKNIEVFLLQVKKQEELKQELLLMKLQAQQSN